MITDWQPHLLIVDMALNGSTIMQHLRTTVSAGWSALMMGLVGRGDLVSKLAVGCALARLGEMSSYHIHALRTLERVARIQPLQDDGIIDANQAMR